MIEILRSKGYYGPEDLLSIISWLNLLGISITFEYTFDDFNVFVGYKATATFPPYASTYTSPIYANKEDVLYHIICSCFDYIPKSYC